MTKNVYFYYPSRRVGGAQLLFYRCADWLTQVNGLKIFYIDYVDGYIKSHQENSNIIFVNKSSYKILDNAIIILPLSLLMTYKKIFDLSAQNKARFLFWSIEPYNFTWAFILNGKFILPKIVYKKAGIKIERLSRLGIIRYMDYHNYHSMYSSFHIKEDPEVNYMPIPFGDDNRFISYHERKNDIIDQQVLSFLWLSRLMNEKIQLIINLFHELDNLKLGKKIVLHIVGDGDCEELIRKEALSHDNFTTIMHGRVLGNELDTLIDSIDIGVAVGTSSLEIAKRFKPVIIGNPSLYNELGNRMDETHSKEYILLSQEIGFSVSHPGHYISGQLPFEDLCKAIISDYERKAYECWQYVKDNHSMESVGNRLLEGINQCYSVDHIVMKKELESLTQRLWLPMKVISVLRRCLQH